MKQFHTPLKVVLIFVIALTSFHGFSQNVGINSSGSAPDASAGLDVSFTNKGILIPRVALTSTTDVSTIASPSTSLVVYNTATAGTPPNNVAPGYYYYTGSAWAKLNTPFATSGNDINYTSGNVTIGTSTATTSALLKISASNKGVLIPNVALTGTADVSTISSPTTSLLVYNTATAGVAPNDVTPGFYYYSGSAWTRLANGSGSGWGITGNTGTNAASNFLGTTDAQDFVIKANNSEKIRVKASASQVLIGGTTNYANTVGERLIVDGGTTESAVMGVYGDINDYVQMGVQNLSNGNAASSDIVATADDGTETSNYIDMGINSSSYTNQKSNYLNKEHVAYIYSNSDANFKIGNGGLGQALCFFTNPSSGTLGTLTANGYERMRIDGNGNVGIGEFWNRTTNGNELTVAEKLTVDGNVAPRTSGSGTVGTSTYRWSSIYANGADIAGAVNPASDNNSSYTLGTSSLRWKTVYAVNSTINTSDRRMKTNIKPLQYGLNQVLALEPVSFNWKSEPTGEIKIGLIAQELKKVVPEVVAGDENKETLGVAYTDLIPVLINAIKDQQKQIEELKKIVAGIQKN